jgi:hypothetical protein
MRRPQLTLVLAAIVGSGGSCSATEPPPFVGTYHAIAANGAALPAPIGSLSIVTGGSAQLSPDGTYALSIASRAATDPTITGSDDMSGSWSEDAGTITLHFDGTSAISATATYASNQLSVHRAQNSYTFQRD